MKAESYIVTYARTLLEFVEEPGGLEAVREEAEILGQFDSQEPRLQIFLENPRVEESDKLAVIDKVFKGKISDVLYKFLVLVVRNGRSAGLVDILEHFCELHDEQVGLVQVHVTTATEMTDELHSQLQNTLAKRLDKTIVLKSDVDANILGGMVVRFSGMVADSSLRTSINSIGARMLSQKLGSELVHED